MAAEPKRLRIFSSPDFLPPGCPHVAMLFPFWGLPPGKEQNRPDYEGFGRYIDVGPSLFDMTSLSRADMAILPFDWHHATVDRNIRSLAHRLDDACRRANKRLAVFFLSDSQEEIPLETAVTFRTSLQRGIRLNDFALPAWGDDFVSRLLRSCVPLRPKLARARVGFCGFAGYRLLPNAPLRRQLRSVIRYVYKRFPGPTIREQTIKVLRNHPDIDTDFILRDQFWTGLKDSKLPKSERNARETFIRNLLDNDYTLCVRGGGNFSFRFYESLAAGRVPLFIDTESVLPYDFEINYEEHSIWVDAASLSNAGEILARAHSQLSPTEFVDLQLSCRRLWEERLSPAGYFSNFHRHLELISI
ncbi:MAG: exostosin domain-containing protein [Actinomycetota bacterium]